MLALHCALQRSARQQLAPAVLNTATTSLALSCQSVRALQSEEQLFEAPHEEVSNMTALQRFRRHGKLRVVAFVVRVWRAWICRCCSASHPDVAASSWPPQDPCTHLPLGSRPNHQPPAPHPPQSPPCCASPGCSACLHPWHSPRHWWAISWASPAPAGCACSGAACLLGGCAGVSRRAC